MKVDELKKLVETTAYKEVKKIIQESINESKEVWYIKTKDGVPLKSCDSKEEANEELPKYQKNTDGELIIEKGVYETYDDMIDELDEMTDDESTEENKSEMKEEKTTCKKCKGKGCDHCDKKGYHLKETKKKVLKLKESEVLELIQDMIIESIPGIEVTKSAQKQSKKDNESHAKEVGKKIKDATNVEGSDNPEFPKPNGKGEKVARTNSEEEDEYVEDTRGGTALNLDYDNEPSEKFKLRLGDALEGSSDMGNNPEWGNAIKTDLGSKLKKAAERKKKKEEDQPMYDKDPQPVKMVSEEKEDKSIINEEIERIKNLTSHKYNSQ